jgi:radical SAM protein with 4Fe4S-binding SPASM domain
MIGITRLLCGGEFAGDTLRYENGAGHSSQGVAPGRGPVVVWNSTRRCNLRCIHCYADATPTSGGYPPGGEELTTLEAKTLIDDLAGFQVPVLLLSGGEPLMRPDFFELVEYAAAKGLRVTVSTNGTLIDSKTARRLKAARVGYVGISLDGLAEQNDFFRGRQGAFTAALSGIRHCREAGQKVGLRLTLSRHNFRQLSDIMKLVEEENIGRVCFYHLVYTGRGSALKDEDLSHRETREALDRIMDWVEDMERRGMGREVLTVDNHADAVYLYLRLSERDPGRARRVWPLLLANGGNRTGMAIGQVDWSGTVHPDQFSADHPLGNVRTRPFSAIWSDPQEPLLGMLRHRRDHLKGRCATCRWLDLCNGNFRARAGSTGDYWQADPACYLTDGEIAGGETG